MAGSTDAPKKAPINTGDTVTLKAQLDESVIKFLQERKYTEDHFWSNIKLIVLTAASLVALTAQFYPLPFPESRPLLMVCCSLYFLFNVVLQVIAWFVDQDKVAVVYTPGSEPRSKVIVRSSLPRFSDIYTLTFEDDAANKLGELKKSVGAYFTQEGEYAETIFEADVDGLLKKNQ